MNRSHLSKEQLRMVHFLLLSVLAYLLATLLSGMGGDDAGLYPRVQTVLWKVGHLNLAAWLGYRADRALFRDRIDRMSPWQQHIRRAMIVAAFVLGMALAL